MPNVKIVHEFVIGKGSAKQEAYLLTWTAQTPVHPGVQSTTSRHYSAWTTLVAAKQAACRVVDRRRLTWAGPAPAGDDLASSQVWRSDCVQVVKP